MPFLRDMECTKQIVRIAFQLAEMNIVFLPSKQIIRPDVRRLLPFRSVQYRNPVLMIFPVIKFCLFQPVINDLIINDCPPPVCLFLLLSSIFPKFLSK